MLTYTDGQTDSTAYSTSAPNDPLTLSLAGGFFATQSGILSGTGGIIKSGAGTLTLSGANSYIGGTTVDGGMLVLQGGGFQDGLIHGTATVNDGAVLRLDFTAVSSGAFPVNSTDTINVNGGGTLDLLAGIASNQSSYVGTVNLSSANGSAANVTSSDGSHLRFGFYANGLLTSTGAMANTWSANMVLVNANGHTMSVNTAAGNNLTISGVISDYAGLGGTPFIKTGAGTLTLTGANTYSGTTTIDNGTLSLSGNGSLYSAGQAAGAIIVNSGGTLSLLRGDSFGPAGHLAVPVSTITINAGGLVTNAGANVFNTFNNLSLNGGELHAESGANATFPAYQLKGTVTAGGASASQITSSGAGNTNIQLGNNTVNGATIFDVADATASSASDLIISANLENGRNGANVAVASQLIKTGAGTLLLSGVNLYSGSTTVNAGTLQLGNSGNHLLDTGAVTINGGTFALGAANETIGSLSGSGGVVELFNGAGRTLTVNQSSNLAYAGVIQGNGGSLIKAGNFILTLTGANTHSGSTVVSAGTLQLGNSGSVLPDSTPLVVNGGTLALGATDETVGSLSGSGGVIQLLNGSGRTLSVNQSTDGSFSGSLQGSGGSLVKSGAGKLTLTAIASYTGATMVNAGTLELSGTAGTILNSASAITVGPDATLRLINTQYNTISNSAVTLLAGGILDAAGTLKNRHNLSTLNLQGGTLAGSNAGADRGNYILNGDVTVSGATTSTISAPVLLNGIRTFNVADGAAATDLLVSGSLMDNQGGTGALIKTGAGTLVLSGANSYPGSTTLQAGTLQLGNSGDELINAGPLTVNGGTFAVGAANSTVNSLSGSGGIIELLNGIGRNLTVNQTADGTYAGTIQGSGGVLTKAGAGTLTLTGASTNSALTAVNAGTLQFANTAAFYSPANRNKLTVNSGAIAAFNFGGAGEFTASDLDQLQTLSSATDGFQSGSFVGVDTTNAAGGTFTYSSPIADPNGATALGVAKLGAGTLNLPAANTFSGGILVFGGTLALGPFSQSVGLVQLKAGSLTGPGSVLSSSAFSVESGAISLILAGPGGLTKTTAGTVTLSGANTYSGGTTILGGTLLLDADQRLAAGSALTVNGGNLSQGSFSQSPGVVTLQAGAINGGTLSASAYNVQSGSISANLSGPAALTKSTAGTLTLSGVNSYTLPTTISGGSVIFAKQTALYNNTPASWTGSNLIVEAGATAVFNVGGTGEFTATDLDTLKTLGSATGGFKNGSVLGLDTTNAGTFSYGGALANTNGGANALSLTKLGAGTLALTAGATYTGATIVNAGTLQVSGGLYSFGASAGFITVNSGATFSLQGNNVLGGYTAASGTDLTVNAGGLVTNSGAAVFNTFNNLKLNGGELRAGGGLSANFPAFQLKGTVTAGGSSASQITTTGAVNSGIQLGNNAANGTTTFSVADATASSAVDLTISAVLEDGRNAGGLAVASGLVKSGAGTLLLSGANTFTGSTSVSAGTLILGNSQALQGSTLTVPFSGFSFGNLTAATVGGISGFSNLALTNTSAAAVALTVGANTATYSGILSGNGSLTKSGPGTLTLAGNNTYTGGTFINAGTLVLSSSQRLADTGALTLNGGTLSLGSNSETIGALSLQSGSITAITTGALTASSLALESGSISAGLAGSAAMTKTTGGLVVLSGTNTGSGTTTISGGTLQFAKTASLYNSTTSSWTTANIIVNSGATAAFNVGGSGEFTTGNLDTLRALGSGTGGFKSGSSLGIDTTNAAGTFSYSSSISNPNGGSNILGLTKLGNGTLSLSGFNIFSGPTNVLGGTLALGTSFALQSSTLILSSPGTLSFGSLSSFSLRGLAGNGDLVLRNSSSAAVALTIGTDSLSTIYSGALSGTGSVTKAGSGTLTLTGANSYTGGTTVSAGTLAGNSASFAGNITNNANVTFNQATDGTYANVISGPGTLTKSGNGSLTLSGANSYLGLTTVSAGTLVGTSASLSGNITNNATVSFDQATAGTHSNAISGTGTLTKSGIGTLTLSGAKTYSGNTVINAGTLRFANQTALYNNATANWSKLTVAPGATAAFNVGGGNEFTAANLDSLKLLGTATTGFNSGASIGLDLTNAPGGAFTYASNIANPNGGLNALGLTVFGGNLTLTGTNTFTGPTTVSAGTLILGNALALQGSTLNSPGALSFGALTAATLGGLAGTGDLALTSGSSAAVALTVGANGTNTSYSGAFSGAGTLTKNGNGTLTLSGANTYSGGTTLNAGIVDAASSNALGSGPVTLNGGQLRVSASALANTITLSANSGIDAAVATTLSGPISGSFALTKSGAGLLTLTGNNSYSSGTTLNAGIVDAASANALGSGPVTLNGGQLRVSAGALANAITLSADSTIDATVPTTLNGLISGSFALTKSGAGALTLSRANSYSGGTTLSAGTLVMGNAAALGSGPVNIAAGATLNSATYGIDLSRLSGAGSFVSSGPALFNAAGNLGLANSLGGTFDLTKSGSGTLTLTGANTYSGGTSLDAGVLVAGANNALGTGPITLNGGELRASGNISALSNAVILTADSTIGGSAPITLSGAVTLARNRDLTVTNSAGTTLSGNISGNGRGLSKYGDGQLTVSGANTYTGGTFIGEGTVHIANVTGSAFGTGAVTVGVGARLSGTGSFSGALQLNGTYAPGNSPGYQATGSQTWNGGAHYEFEINDAIGNAGSQWDLLALNGSLSLTNTAAVPFVLDLFSLTPTNVAGPLSNLVDGQTYTWELATTTSPITGFSADKFALNSTAFDAANPGGHFSLQLGNRGAGGAAGTSLNLVYVAVPEPGTWMLSALSLLGLASVPRRLRRRG